MPCIEIYALAASATKPVTSMRGLAGTDSREDDEAAKIDLTYSTTRDINRLRLASGTLLACLIQVPEVPTHHHVRSFHAPTGKIPKKYPVQTWYSHDLPVESGHATFAMEALIDHATSQVT